MLVKFLDSKTVAEGTMLFRFEKPKGFEYRAGQNCDFFLINPKETDEEGNKRTFSFASAPHEKDLTVATRLRDTAFKRVLKNMKVGEGVEMEGPFGDFFLHENAKRTAVFLAGGIGITPFFSMIKDATERKLPHRIVLFYSNRRSEDAPFLEELKSLAKNNKNFTFVPTITQPEKSKEKWQGETGYISAEKIKRFVSDDSNPLFYIAGPLGMLSSMRGLLNTIGVSNDDIRSEEFIGY
ncbi:MAG: FAD-dependent oxidoreductase [Minisyncoccia bacterium]